MNWRDATMDEKLDFLRRYHVRGKNSISSLADSFNIPRNTLAPWVSKYRDLILSGQPYVRAVSAKRLSVPKEQLLAELWHQGCPIKDIANRLGCHVNTVTNVRERLGLPPRYKTKGTYR